MKKPDQSQSNPVMKHDCLKKLQSILDGEASPVERKDFLEKHLDVCMPCYKHYHLEMAIRDLLKSKCWNHQVPADIVESIRSKINSAY